MTQEMAHLSCHRLFMSFPSSFSLLVFCVQEGHCTSVQCVHMGSVTSPSDSSSRGLGPVLVEQDHEGHRFRMERQWGPGATNGVQAGNYDSTCGQ